MIFDPRSTLGGPAMRGVVLVGVPYAFMRMENFSKKNYTGF